MKSINSINCWRYLRENAMDKIICFNYKYDSDYADRIHILEEYGFDGVFIYSQYKPKEYIDLILDSSLSIETLHLPYKRFVNDICVDSRYANILWIDGINSSEYVSELINEVNFAKNYGIPTVVMHITGGDTPPPINKVAVENIKKVLRKCEEHEITLCLENLRRLDYLQYIFEALNSPYLKFCFDSGHASTMTRNLETFPWDFFGQYLHCVHLNDNDGINDQHQIPFSGNINWATLINKIFSYNQKLNLTLEVRSSTEERETTKEVDFIKNCYDSLRKLEILLEV